MASKIELTIAPSYVPSWGIVEAVRELFQNALDQQKQNPTNKMSWEYDPEAQRLRICNKYSTLEASSLLLGATTKADDTSTIGQFGEGYKIATLVLLRNGKKITFYNYGAREVWCPRFVNSRRFGTQILTFFIDKKAFWDTIPNNDLTIEIEGITEEEYMQQIVPSNLHIRTDYKVIESTYYGDIVDIPGKVFVNGLFVCDFKPYKYGYNFKPEHLKLDRDRKMASSFDLMWLASQVWSKASEESMPLTIDLLKEGAADVGYIDSVASFGSNYLTLRNACYEAFHQKYGAEALPVTDQSELNNVPKGYKGVIVPATYGRLIKSSTKFTASAPPIQTEAEKIFDKIDEWINKVADRLTTDETIEINDLVARLREEI